MQRLKRGQPIRVAVKRREQAHTPIAIQQMDDASVGERRDGQPSDLSEIGLAVQ
jgi:hypothetical protein